MNRQQIKELLDEWIDKGLLGSRMTFVEMEKREGEKTLKRKLKEKLLIPTSFSLNLYVAPEIAEELEKLIDNKQILSVEKAMVLFKVYSSYKVNELCAQGGLLKYNRLGKNSLIYINE